MYRIKLVYGERFDAAYVNDKQLNPEWSLRVFNHSPDGFSWGYGGSGPAQLALAILLEALADEEVAVRLHQQFKEEFLAELPQSDAYFEVDIEAWAVARKSLR